MTQHALQCALMERTPTQRLRNAYHVMQIVRHALAPKPRSATAVRLVSSTLMHMTVPAVAHHVSTLITAIITAILAVNHAITVLIRQKSASTAGGATGTLTQVPKNAFPASNRAKLVLVQR